MSMLAMATSNPHHPFRRDFNWENGRSPDLITSRPRQDSEKIALPSIRQAFPELQLRVLPPDARAAPSSASPALRPGGMHTPPEYVHSQSPTSNKRRRLSVEEERDFERANRVPRLYASPARGGGHDQQAARPASPSATARPAVDSWRFGPGTSPPLASGGLPSIRSPTAMEASERPGQRPTLPGLPFMHADRAAEASHRSRGRSSDVYLHDMSRSPFSGHPGEPRPAEAGADMYRPGGYGYSHSHHPSRSVGSIHAPYPPSNYGPHYQEYVRVGEGSLSVNGDNKQRKRRGNLPKETTDKLRAWFAAHLSHPYPTEEEKHELMRQTGLQMNQISNWFINARRRQLPGMLSNSRVESEVAASVRGLGGGGGVLPSTERAEYETERGKRASPLSDETDSACDDELDALGRRRRVKRGSV